MKNKLFIVLLVGILLVAFLMSCNGAARSLIECGEEVVSLMAEMVENEAYESLYNMPPAYDETIDKLRAGEYSKSLAVYELLIPEEELLKSFGTEINKENFSDDLYKYVCSSAYTSFASRINQLNGVESIAVMSAFSAQKNFTVENLSENKIYLYVFEGGCPVAVTFVADGEDSVRAIGHFIINDSFATDGESSIKESCESFDIKGVTVKLIYSQTNT